MELQGKYKAQLEEGTTNSVATKLSFFFFLFSFFQGMKLFYTAIQRFLS